MPFSAVTYPFVFNLIQTRRIYPFFSAVRIPETGEVFPNTDTSQEPVRTDKLHLVRYIPPFLVPELSEESERRFSVIKLQQFQGYMADLHGCANIDQFLKERLSSKSRNNLKRHIRKLEACFNVTYRSFWGRIDPEEYRTLMNQMKRFLQRRFHQRGESHEMLRNWEFIERTTIDLVLKRQAHLSALYCGEKPVGISLGYVIGKIFHSAISSYDIDYSIFSLGQIQIYKKIEWSLEHEIRFFDLSVGDLDYKRMWCNVIYPFEHRLLYARGNWVMATKARGLVSLIKFKDFLKRYNVHKAYHALRKRGKRREGEDRTEPFAAYEVLNDPLNGEFKGLMVDHESGEFGFLRKPVYDFQYKKREPAAVIQVVKMEGTGKFLIKGKTHSQLIRFIHEPAEAS